MKRKQYSAEQIVAVLGQAEHGHLSYLQFNPLQASQLWSK